MSTISRINWRIRVIMGLLLALVCSLSSFLLVSATGGALQLSSDPYTNASSQHKTQVGPDTFSYAKTVVSAFQSGYFFDGGSSNIGWASSKDGGNTWKKGFLPGTTVYATPKGTYARASDPAVAYDARHNTWMIVSLVLDAKITGAAILVSRSTDGGFIWTNPVTVAQNHGGNLDKAWIVCDNSAKKSKYYGHCYVEFDDNAQGDLIQLSTSTDGGSSWSTPKDTKDQAHGLGGNPLVQTNGTVIVPEDNPFASAAFAYTSTDGGKSWSSTVPIATFNKVAPAGGIRSLDLLSAEIDGSDKVYVLWYDCSFEKKCSTNDIVMSTSSDGQTWSKLQRIPIDPVGSGTDHFLPAIAVDKKTSGSSTYLGVLFYFYPKANCTQSTCQLEAGVVTSTSSGSTWSKEVIVTPSPMNLTWLANTSQGYSVGDYFSLSFVNTGKVVPAFIYATAPNGKVFSEAAYTITGGMDIVGGTLSSANDRVISSNVSPSVTQTAH